MLTQRPVQLFLLATLLAFVVSVTLWFGGDREEGLFVGLWVPSILAFGAFSLSARNGSRHE